MKAKDLKRTPVKVTSNQDTVWVNGPSRCLARFCRAGAEYNEPEFHAVIHQDQSPGGHTTLTEWQSFVTEVKERHGVDVEAHRPRHVKE